MSSSAAPRLVILAAGASERLGQPKALVDLAGRTPLEHLLESWPEQACGTRATVVTGRHHAEIVAALPASARPLENNSWSEGRSGGVALAARALPGCDLVLAPVDCPLVPRSVFEALLQEWARLKRPAQGFLAPFTRAGDHPRRFGHPIVIGQGLAAQLAAWAPDRPLRDLRSLAEPLAALQVPGNSILDNLDTPADLERLQRQALNRPLGS